MKGLWKLLNSRKFAVYLLLAVLVVTVFSSFLPNTYTVTTEEWEEISRSKTFVFWLASNFSTPYVVKNPAFIAVVAFLFLSTVSCTVSRVRQWLRLRNIEFEKEKAFSFSVERESSRNPEELRGDFLSMLGRKRWECDEYEDEGSIVLEAQKGSGTGFWGSVVFHLGLVICFLAAPATALTLFRGELVLPEGETVWLKEGLASHEGHDVATLPDVAVTVTDLRGVFAEGVFEYYFGGTLRIGDREYPISVNEPVYYRGYQLSLHEYGYTPRLVIRENGTPVFDYLLNLRHSEKGDYFAFGQEGQRLFVILFPDFIREGNLLGSKSREPRNPWAVVRFYEGDVETAKGLIRLGGTEQVGPYTVEFPELRNWANFIVVKEWGVPVVWIGMLVGLPGLLVRFLSNERRLELRVMKAPGGSRVLLRGYSRYYPAFLEREVTGMAGRLAGRK